MSQSRTLPSLPPPPDSTTPPSPPAAVSLICAKQLQLNITPLSAVSKVYPINNRRTDDADEISASSRADDFFHSRLRDDDVAGGSDDDDESTDDAADGVRETAPLMAAMTDSFSGENASAVITDDDDRGGVEVVEEASRKPLSASYSSRWRRENERRSR